MRLPHIATLRSWTGPAVVGIATFYTAMLVTLAAWTFVPVLFGWSPMAISSGSMQPRIGVGDVVVVDRYDGRDLSPGTIATYREAGRLVTHRIIEVVDDGYVTKGDANAQPDSTVLTADNIVGTGRVLVPYLGRPHLWATSSQALELVAFGAVSLLALTITVTRVGIRVVPAGVEGGDGDDDTLGPGPPPDLSSAPVSGSPALTAMPVRVDEVGVVWHARVAPGRRSRPVRRIPGPRRLLTVAVATLVLTSVASTAGAALSATTSSSVSSWAGHLGPATGADATAGCSGGQAWVQVSWDLHERADGYQLERDDGDGWQPLAALGDTIATGARDTNVVEDDIYDYRVVATASSWHADPSSTATVDTTGVCDG